MIKVQGTIPKEVGVAVSGGVDSMAVLDFLSRKHTVTAYCFDHGTDYGKQAMGLVEDFCQQKGISLQRGLIKQAERPKGKSWELHWRDERWAWLKSQPQEIVMAHHLDDCVEQWAFTACNGEHPRPIPYRHANVFRPFRLTRKQDLINWATKHAVPWLEDPSNHDPSAMFTRTFIRLFLVPNMLRVNPGIHKVVKKKLMELGDVS